MKYNSLGCGNMEDVTSIKYACPSVRDSMPEASHISLLCLCCLRLFAVSGDLPQGR